MTVSEPILMYGNCMEVNEGEPGEADTSCSYFPHTTALSMLKRLVLDRAVRSLRSAVVTVRPYMHNNATQTPAAHSSYRCMSILTDCSKDINKSVLESSQKLFARGIQILAELENDSALQLERATASEVLADISAVRKSAASTPRGALSDFMKAKNDRDAKLKSQGSSDDSTRQGSAVAVVVDRSANSAHNAVDHKEAEAVALVTAAADLGLPEALCFLGNRALKRAMDEKCLDSMQGKVQLALNSRDFYERASQQGCGEASYNLGVLLRDGLTVEPAHLISGGEEDGGVTRVVTSATASSIGPLKVSTVSRRRRSGQPPRTTESPVEVIAVDLSKSLACFELAAAQGEASAALICGQCYSGGEGGAVQIDADKAVSYLLQALKDEKVAPKAHFYLAQIYDTGLEGVTSVERNESAYLSHLQAALQGRDEDALHTVASMHLQLALPEESGDVSLSEAEKVFLLRDCGERSSVLPHEQHHCSHDHDHDHDHSSCRRKEHQLRESDRHHHKEHAWPAKIGTAAQHLERAVDLLRAASAAGQAEATLALGVLVYRGLVRSGDTDGAVADPKRRAFELYELAAEQGSLDAWRNIASMHFLGEGVPRCEKTAREIMRVVFGKAS